MTFTRIPPRPVTVAAIAALAFIVACTSHEVLGHGAMCLVEGGRIALLTSVYFRCENAGVLTDLAGPFANLILGMGAWALLARRTWPPDVQLSLVLSLAFNLFWVAGCMLLSSVASQSDFAYALRSAAVDPPWVGRAALGTLGMLVYALGMHAIAKFGVPGIWLANSYATAGIVSCMAALCYVGLVGPAIREAAMESFGAAVGLLLARGRTHRMPDDSLEIPPANGIFWLAASVLATIAFVLLLGRGLIVTGSH